MNMDHHCGFSDTCVGRSNIKYYMLFTMYIAFLVLVNYYIWYYYMNHMNYWWYQNPRLNNSMWPNIFEPLQYRYFPIRCDKGEFHIIDAFIFWGRMFFLEMCAENFLRILYQYKQGTSYIITLKGTRDKHFISKLKP